LKFVSGCLSLEQLLLQFLVVAAVAVLQYSIMRSLNAVISRIGVLLILSMILIFAATRGSELVNMYDRGPGYVAMNIVLTLDATVAAPEQTVVTYDFEHADDVKSLYIEDGCSTNSGCKVAVSRYSTCEEALRWTWEGAGDVLKWVGRGAERVGRCILTLGSSCGSKESTTSSHRDAITSQMRAAYYKRPVGVSYEHDPEKCIELNWDVCDIVRGAIGSDHYYFTPKEITVSSFQDDLDVEVKCDE
jgi:hypothetical protein